MNKEDIIRMAREAGFVAASFCRWSAYTDDLARFAALVAAHEREECAKDADCWADQRAGQEIAEAIRARGNT